MSEGVSTLSALESKLSSLQRALIFDDYGPFEPPAGPGPRWEVAPTLDVQPREGWHQQQQESNHVRCFCLVSGAPRLKFANDCECTVLTPSLIMEDEPLIHMTQCPLNLRGRGTSTSPHPLHITFSHTFRVAVVHLSRRRPRRQGFSRPASSRARAHTHITYMPISGPASSTSATAWPRPPPHRRSRSRRPPAARLPA